MKKSASKDHKKHLFKVRSREIQLISDYKTQVKASV